MLRTLEETPHRREPNAVVHFDLLHMRESAVDAGVNAADGIQHLVVILENVGGYIWLTPSRACTANGTVERLFAGLLLWAANHMGKQQREPFATAWCANWRTHWWFSLANSAWINGTVECIMREVIHGAKAMLNDDGRPLSGWIVVLQRALSTAWRKRLQTTPYHVMMRRESRTAFSALTERDDEVF